MGHINYLLSQLLTHQNSSINHITKCFFAKKTLMINISIPTFFNSPTNSSPNQNITHTHTQIPVQKIASLQKPLKKQPPCCHNTQHTPHSQLSWVAASKASCPHSSVFLVGIFWQAGNQSGEEDEDFSGCFSPTKCESFGILLPFLPWWWKWKMAKIAKVMTIGRTRFSLPSWWEER